MLSEGLGASIHSSLLLHDNKIKQKNKPKSIKKKANYGKNINKMIPFFKNMKTIYLTMIVLVLIFGGLWVIVGGAANTMLCIAYWIISMPNPEIFVFPNFESCGR